MVGNPLNRQRRKGNDAVIPLRTSFWLLFLLGSLCCAGLGSEMILLRMARRDMRSDVHHKRANNFDDLLLDDGVSTAKSAFWIAEALSATRTSYKDKALVTTSVESPHQLLAPKHHHHKSSKYRTTAHRAHDKHHKSTTFLGFLRISKTGSTALEYALRHALRGARQLPRFYAAENPPSDLAVRNGEDAFHSDYHVDFCFYAHHRMSRNEFSRRRKSEVVAPHQREGSCPHRQLNSMQKHFSRRAHYLQQGRDSHNDMLSPSPLLQMFTIVRDPFERLVSLFYYTYKLRPKWNSLHTPEQNECIGRLDLECWLRLLHEQGAPSSSLPFQFRQLAYGLDQAIQLITLPTVNHTKTAFPGVFVVLNECFDTSVRVLVSHFPDVFGPVHFTKRHLDDFYQRQREDKIEMRVNHNKQQPNNTEELRQLAREWFAEDYIFYEAAVRQFQQYWAVMRKETPDMWKDETCLLKLDQILLDLEKVSRPSHSSPFRTPMELSKSLRHRNKVTSFVRHPSPAKNKKVILKTAKF